MHKFIIILYFLPSLLFGQTTTELSLHSSYLNADRKIWVNTPEHYELRKDSLHLIFLLDGNNRSLFEYTVASKRFLEHNAVDLSDFNTPESIIIGIEQSEDRWDDFGDSLRSPLFQSFLEKELIPYVNAHYRTVPYRILIGHSLAARFAINTLLSQPDLFNAIIAASPAFPQKLTDKILARFDMLLHTKLPHDKALFFSTTYLKDDNTEEGFRYFSESLVKSCKSNAVNNFRFQFNSSKTLGHGKSPYFSIPEGLHFIYDPSLWQLTTDSLFPNGNTSPAAVNRYQQRIQQRFGIPVSIHPFATILADELVKQHKTKEAIALLRTEAELQPTDINLFAQLLALMKKYQSADYSNYEAKLKSTFSELKLSQKEQNDWMDWIRANSQ